MNKISAYSRNSLLAQLSEVDITVPPRGEGRTTMHEERWSICRLLSTLAWEHRLQYPLILSKRERPDFACRFGNFKAGIEVTGAIKEDLARLHALPDAQKDGVIDLSLFKWRDQKKTLDELREIASQTQLTGIGWPGDAPEQELSDAMTDVVATKTKKLNDESYTCFDEDWLLIYENLSLPALNRSKSASYLCLALSEYWSDTSFTRIFIETGQFMVELSQDSLKMHELCNLWS